MRTMSETWRRSHDRANIYTELFTWYSYNSRPSDLSFQAKLCIMAEFDSIDNVKRVNARCLDFLLMEMISNSIRVTQHKEVESRSNGKSDNAVEELDDAPGSVAILDHPSINTDDVTLRNETYGFQVGIRLCELLMYKNLQSSKITNILDIMKFVCRDVWRCLYGKQMDNLRTNHRGVFVLVDNNCRLISSMNSSKGLPDTISRARSFLWFPCGVIRGILLSFGIESLVNAEINQFPSVIFSIQTSINN